MVVPKASEVTLDGWMAGGNGASRQNRYRYVERRGSDQIRRARCAERGKPCEDSTIRSVDPTHPHEISALPTQEGF